MIKVRVRDKHTFDRPVTAMFFVELPGLLEGQRGIFKIHEYYAIFGFNNGQVGQVVAAYLIHLVFNYFIQTTAVHVAGMPPKAGISFWRSFFVLHELHLSDTRIRRDITTIR